MSDTIDPKELKILSDILALVLEEHAGQSESALATIRSRARKNGVTGGALKNLFTAIAPNPPQKPPPKPRAPRATKASAAAAKEIQELHTRIAEMAGSIRKLDLELRDMRTSNEALCVELNQTRQARAETQAALSVVQARPAATSRSGLLVAATVGLLTGLALTEAWHFLVSPSAARASAAYPPAIHHTGQAMLLPPANPLHSGSMPS